MTHIKMAYTNMEKCNMTYVKTSHPFTHFIAENTTIIIRVSVGLPDQLHLENGKHNSYIFENVKKHNLETL